MLTDPPNPQQPCDACGKELYPVDRFCGSCGEPVPTATHPALSPDRSVGELTEVDPRMVSRFHIIGRLGVGGMGVVYLGVGDGNALVAVKLIQESLASQAQFRTRFSREVAAMRSVRSAFIANVIDADPDAAVPWLAMEYVPGETLAEFVANTGALPVDQIRPFALGLADAIDVIHSAGVVHRDLKPSNVVLSPTGPRIIDFGVAHAEDATSVTVSGQVLGSMNWLAPEQMSGTAIATQATDVHAWGALVYYAATGQSPYGVARPDVLAWRIANTEPDTSKLPSGLAGLNDLVPQALSRDPATRPTAATLIRLLGGPDSVSHDDDATVVLAGWGLHTATRLLPPLPPRGDTSAAAHTPRHSRRTKIIGAAVAGLVSIALASAAIFGLANRNQPPAVAAPSIPATSPAPVITSQSAPAPAPEPTWPTVPSGKIGVVKTGVAPAFPASLPGYKRQSEKTDQMRVFRDPGESSDGLISDFPVTMNGCALHQFFVRWRSVRPNISIGSQAVSSDAIKDSSAAPAERGFMSLTGCGQPKFTFGKDANGLDTLADIITEYEVWVPTAG